MYGYPISFPEQTNREDIYRTVSIFDDDTGQPVNLAGITRLVNPNGFTGSNWVITDGGILTTSATSFRVPGYPTTGQLAALSLTTNDLNLAILPGDPITIADVTGQATVTGFVTSYAAATGALVCQIGLTFQCEIRRERERGTDFGFDFSPFFDFGGGTTPSSAAPLITAALGTGLSVTDLGFLLINIPEVTVRQLGSLTSRSYILGLTATDSVSTRQILLARLPILYGAVTN